MTISNRTTETKHVRREDEPRAKYFISPGNFQGRPPLIPIPIDWVAATMMVIFCVVEVAMVG